MPYVREVKDALLLRTSYLISNCSNRLLTNALRYWDAKITTFLDVNKFGLLLRKIAALVVPCQW